MGSLGTVGLFKKVQILRRLIEQGKRSVPEFVEEWSIKICIQITQIRLQKHHTLDIPPSIGTTHSQNSFEQNENHH